MTNISMIFILILWVSYLLCQFHGRWKVVLPLDLIENLNPRCIQKCKLFYDPRIWPKETIFRFFIRLLIWHFLTYDLSHFYSFRASNIEMYLVSVKQHVNNLAYFLYKFSESVMLNSIHSTKDHIKGVVLYLEPTFKNHLR